MLNKNISKQTNLGVTHMQINHQGTLIEIPEDVMQDIKDFPIDHDKGQDVLAVLSNVLDLDYDNIIESMTVVDWRVRDNLTDNIIKDIVTQAILVSS